MTTEVFWAGFNLGWDGNGDASPKFLWPDDGSTAVEYEKTNKHPLCLVRLEINRKTGAVSATMERKE